MMTKTAKTVGEEQPEKISIKAQKERDAEDAMRAYRQEQAAVLQRTAELRALRLARDAKLAAAAARTPLEPTDGAKAEPAKKAKPKKAAAVRIARGR
ncbi:MAG: hypothetical protein K2Y27_11995 [Xanthobacteraceae bacterium]|nr:hypothetical protein [Xanthobacteraceae bacterium]